MNLFKANRSGALARFRLMANIAGVMSLLLWLVYLPIKLTAANDNVPNLIRSIAVVHGFAYMVYVLVTFNYCFAVRKPLKTTVFYMLAGTFPVASFVADRRAVAEFAAFTAKQ
jgi:integral membrane protein